MKKILLSTVFAIACLQNVHADPFEIDLEQLGNLKKMVIEFKEMNPNKAVFCALDEIIQGTEKKQDLSPNRMKNIAIIQALRATRKADTYPPTIKDTDSLEDNFMLVSEFHNNHKKWKYTEEEQLEFYNKFIEFEEYIVNGFNDQQTQSIMAAAQKSGLRQFTSKILGMATEMYNYDTYKFSTEEKEMAFQLLKNSGALKTKIEKVEGFVYSPAEDVADFLNNHPETDTIVVGCGHFIPRVTWENLEAPIHLLAPFEGGCQMCPHPTHHKDELTIDADICQNPDIVADGTDLKLWNALPANRLARIVDDSLYQTLFQKEGLMDLLIHTLRPGGEIIYVNGNDFSENILYTKPF